MWILMKVDVLVSPQDIKDSSELSWSTSDAGLVQFGDHLYTDHTEPPEHT